MCFLDDGIILFEIGKRKAEFSIIETNANLFEIVHRHSKSDALFNQPRFRGRLRIKEQEGSRLCDLLHIQITIPVLFAKVFVIYNVIVVGSESLYDGNYPFGIIM